MKSTAAVGAVGLLVSLAGADPVISNLTSPTLVGTNIGVKAAGFRMPAGASFRLDGVTISVLAFPLGTSHPTFAVFEGVSAPTTLVVNLKVPAAVATAQMTLIPDHPVELREGRTYWIVGNFGTNADLNWAQNPDVFPTGLATHVAYLFGGAPSGVENSYRIEGTWSGTCISFDTLPGTDGYLGTSDDTPIAAPPFFVDQNAQVTSDFGTQGVLFLPNPGVNDRNEILNNDTFFIGTLSSEPNLITTFGLLNGNIDAEFVRPVYRVEADIGLGLGTDILEIYDASGGLINAASARTGHVTLTSSRPIARMRLRPATPDGTTGMDDLCLGFLPPDSCQADLSGSADANDPSYGVPDGIIDSSDFFYYLDRFVEPCP
jgi:hypothetical protein